MYNFLSKIYQSYTMNYEINASFGAESEGK